MQPSRHSPSHLHAFAVPPLVYKGYLDKRLFSFYLRVIFFSLANGRFTTRWRLWVLPQKPLSHDHQKLLALSYKYTRVNIVLFFFFYPTLKKPSHEVRTCTSLWSKTVDISPYPWVPPPQAGCLLKWFSFLNYSDGTSSFITPVPFLLSPTRNLHIFPCSPLLSLSYLWVPSKSLNSSWTALPVQF